jgi:exopolysaccharide biosynthesis polyprenyl glycosylphosphotransferase
VEHGVTEGVEAAIAALPFTFDGEDRRSLPTARRRDALYRRLLAAADSLSIVLAMGLGLVVIDGAHLEPAAILTIPALIVLAKAFGLYDRDQHLLHKTTLDEFPRLFHLAVLAAFSILLLAGVLIDGSPTPVGLLVVASTVFGGMASLRAGARMIARRFAPVERCAILGDLAEANDLAEKIASNHCITVKLVGNIPSARDAKGSIEPPHDIVDYLVEHEIERVVLTPGAETRKDMLAFVGRIKRLGVKISVLPSISRAGETSFELDRLAGVTLLGVRGFDMGRSSLILKRAFDLVVAGVGAIVFAPVMGAIAVTIKIGGPGPVFYRQMRIGRHGEPFKILKFRTMVDGADARRPELEHLNEAKGGLFKIADDPRVTRVGRFLRSRSLDELPQLLNILRGDMSLVGPRPLVWGEDRLIKGWHRYRLAVRPGMTGYWQMLGSSRIPLAEMVKLDYAYVQNWSLWNDIQIVLRTIWSVASRRGL